MPPMKSMPRRAAAVLPVIVLALLLVNCAENPVSGRTNFVTMSESDEIQVGRKEDAEIKKDYGVYNNPALQRYVNDIGQRLARVSHRPGLDYHFTVVDSPEINAFALPGGYVYITRGILAYLNSEAELAGVLGHEIGHVTARHSVQQLSAATAAGAGATLLGIFVPALRNQAGDTLINALGNALLSGYGREHELEADKLGATYLARAGYDPQAMIKVLTVLKNQEVFDADVARSEGRQPRAYHGVFATHPDADTRLHEVVGEAGHPVVAARTNPEEFLRTIDKMAYGYSDSQGFVRNSAFYHRELGISVKLPPNWRVSNQPDKVTATNPASDAMLEMRSAGPAQGTPIEMLRKTIGSTRETSEAPINGLRAAVTTTAVRGLPTRAAVIFLDKNAFLLGAQAKSAAAFQRVLPDINSSITSFHALTDAERSTVRPLALRIINAPRDGRFSELARNSPLGKNAVSHLRLLNALYPGGEPVPGQALKIVE
jgi:predicted Zn-dependent protease